MEKWEIDFEWLRVQHIVKDAMQKETLPGMNAVLLLIGIQELGWVPENITKEQKKDLMHIAVCRVLSPEGYYEFGGRDQDNWPHWNAVRPVKVAGPEAQEALLKTNIIRYFKEQKTRRKTRKSKK